MRKLFKLHIFTWNYAVVLNLKINVENKGWIFSDLWNFQLLFIQWWFSMKLLTTFLSNLISKICIIIFNWRWPRTETYSTWIVLIGNTKTCDKGKSCIRNIYFFPNKVKIGIVICIVEYLVVQRIEIITHHMKIFYLYISTDICLSLSSHFHFFIYF